MTLADDAAAWALREIERLRRQRPELSRSQRDHLIRKEARRRYIDAPDAMLAITYAMSPEILKFRPKRPA